MRTIREAGEKQMKRKINLMVFMLLLLFSRFSVATVIGSPISVFLEKDEYHPGEPIVVSGNSDPLEAITVQVVSDNITIYEDFFDSDENGTFVHTLQMDSNSTPGDYILIVLSTGEETQEEFEITPSKVESFGVLVIIVSNSKGQTEMLINSLPPSDDDTYEHAIDNFNEANSAYQIALDYQSEGKYNEASDWIKEALELYGESLSRAIDYQFEVEEEVIDETISSIEIQSTINRTYQVTSIIQNTLEQLSQMGVNVSHIVPILATVEDQLNVTSILVAEGNYSRAEDLLDEIEDLLDEAEKLSKNANKFNTYEKLVHFTNKTAKRIMKLEERVAKVFENSNTSSEILELVTRSFNDIYAQLEDIEGSLETEDLDELDDLLDFVDDLFDDVDDVFDILEDEVKEASEGFEELGEFEARIEYYGEKIKDLSDYGLNTTILESMLADAISQNQAAEAELEQANYRQFDDYIDELDDILDDLEDYVEDFEDLDEDFKDADDEFDEKYLEIEEEMAEYREEIEVLREEGKDTTNLEEELNEIEQSLEKASHLEDLEEIEAQLEELEEHIEDAEDDETNDVDDKTDDDEVNEEDVARGEDDELDESSEIQSLYDQISQDVQVIQVNVTELTEAGYDTEELIELVEQASNLIDEAAQMIADGDNEGAEETLEEIEDILKDIVKLIEKLTEESEDQQEG